MNLLHVLGKQLSNASDCSVWKIAFNSGKTLVCAKICFPTLRLLILACFKKKYNKKCIKCGWERSFSSISLFIHFPPTPPSRRDSNQTFHWVHLWNWKFPALNSPLWWQIKKSGFGGLTWNCRRCSVRFYTLMGQSSNSVVHGEERLLKAVIDWLIDWFIYLIYPPLPPQRLPFGSYMHNLLFGPG